MKSLRTLLGISQEELAERADLHRTYIAGIERGGRNITLKSVEKLARALQVSVAALVSIGDESALQPRAEQSKLYAEEFVDLLLVEDSPNDVELTLHAFQEVRFANHLSVVRDGAEALDYIFCTGKYAHRRNKPLPHVILLDLGLPKVSGMEVLRRIKSDPRTRAIPVIVLTVSQTSRDIAESRRLGAATYIVKPVDFHNFSRVTPQLSLKWALMKGTPQVEGYPAHYL